MIFILRAPLHRLGRNLVLPPDWLSRNVCVLLIAFLSLIATPAHAQQCDMVDLNEVTGSALGNCTSYFIEDDHPIDLQQAISLQRAGKFDQAQVPVLNFGIGASPVWLHLVVNNPRKNPMQLYLLGGITWIDYLDAYVVHAEQLQNHLRTGDRIPHAQWLVPPLGYAMPVTFSPGRTELYLRVESPDPMVLPIKLLSETQLRDKQLGNGYYYGFFYGFMVSLCIYNLLLFLGLKERSYLYYSLALISIIFCNLGYTGHGFAYLWPGLPGLQNYIILFLMVLYSVVGLQFAGRFLDLRQLAPRIYQRLQWFAGAGLVTITLCILSASQLAAALVAFAFLILFTAVMLLLGARSVRQGQQTGRYFLSAIIFGSIGLAITDLGVWGKIPFSLMTFHAAEVGLALEATLLAMALAYKIRRFQQANVKAEKMARLDHLTGLYNRRAFQQLAIPSINSAARGNRPLSLVLMDIDYFKQINDKYGHDAGDKALMAISDFLRNHCRGSDIVARWGGEEFILLLTETDLAHAVSYTERLRQTISQLRVPVADTSISITASFGLVEQTDGRELKELIRTADENLYRAKAEGRNRVCWETS